MALWCASMVKGLAALLGVAPVPAALGLELQTVAQHLDPPTALGSAGDERLFIVEQPGRIRILSNGKLLSTPFLDISRKVGSGGERGLLGLAFHPDYARTGMFWVNYTDRNGDTVIARFSVSRDANRADPDSERVLLHIDQPYPNHNGGQIAFGPPEGKERKRYLYVGLGDGGGAGDPANRAQDDDNPLGKMLRLDPSAEADATSPFYAVPPDNPRARQKGPAALLWAKGLRNPWRFSFDARNGELWIADVGQNAWEEINRTAAGAPGVNYGWRIMEGRHCFHPKTGCDKRGLTPPVYEYRNGGERCAIVGGYVYRGARLAALAGTYVFADFCSGEVFGLKVRQGRYTAERLFTSPSRVLTFGEDASRELYLGTGGGEVYRLAP